MPLSFEMLAQLLKIFAFLSPFFFSGKYLGNCEPKAIYAIFSFRIIIIIRINIKKIDFALFNFILNCCF